ncbi:tetratricopeptide repeat protein [Luteibacter aegosomatis]|uniref:tetratricopeptide repeat protein n=1 Tax=Luteibacter aegosomatis TaxID=2911537 RepID=UPI001FFAA935|nr:tetratricopeptide repeat protein [Luteibacter aegosomatis]UPG85258.1 tetratricopeptide repeat protein [Luteibacter aegosomatis]
MNGLLANFHFIQPGWLWLLLAVPVAAWLLSRRQPGARVLARLADPALLPHLLDGAPASTRAPAFALAAAGILAVLALAGPTWNRQTQQLFAERSAQVVVVSMSQHMLSHDVVPDRLSRARYKVRKLYEANAGGLNALVAYTGEAFTVAPLTTDAHSVDDLLNALSPDTMPVEGDDAGKAIDLAADLIRRADLHGGSIVLVTDRVDADAAAAARRARAAGDRVSVLGIGTSRGGPITSPDGGFIKDAQGAIVMAPRDDASLSSLADAGGGRYVPVANDASDVSSLSAMLHDEGAGNAVSGATSGQWQDRGAWLLLPLLPLVALAFRRGWLIVFVLALLPLRPAHADGLADLFRTRDQQAAHALAKGDAAAAQSLANSASLRGAAAYRAGDYAAAAAALQEGKDADSQYNLGNALAKQQRYEEAIAAYDRALKTNPGDADAAANRKAVEDFLKQQKQNKNDDSKNGQGGKQGDKDPSKRQQGQQGSQGGQDKDAQNQGKDGQSSGDAGGNEGQPQQGDPSKAGEGEGKDAGQRQGKGESPQGDAATKSQAERAQAERAQSALKQQMDAALGKDGKAQDKKDDGSHDLGTMSAEDASSKLPADVRRSLMRVPDDPGGLLRRKFMLEYQRRHGAEPEE